MNMKKLVFDIDVVGACNLRCPCCPQGNIQDHHLSRGFMDPTLFAKIVSKVTSECRVKHISLFSWGEPLLHPRLAELIHIVRKEGVPSYLSSNLNTLNNIDAVMAENPSHFRISLSGFSQKVYGHCHRGGDIERVKKHMVELAAAKKRNNATTHIYVYYHRYRHNLKEEPLMRQFAAELGFDFQPVWALFFPLEKILALAGEKDFVFAVTEEDLHFLEHLAVPVTEVLEVAQAYKKQPCALREDAISIDSQGNVQLCCGVFDNRQFTLGNYLTVPLTEIQRIRESHPMCSSCMAHGAHIYLTYGLHDLSELAMEHIDPEDAELLNLHQEIAKMKLQKRMSRVYDRLFGGILPATKKAMLAAYFFQLQRLFSRLCPTKSKR
jgi:MoaA/NifB/PqqE/SkfB family radical SAM enzyme